MEIIALIVIIGFFIWVFKYIPKQVSKDHPKNQKSKYVPPVNENRDQNPKYQKNKYVPPVSKNYEVDIKEIFPFYSQYSGLIMVKNFTNYEKAEPFVLRKIKDYKKIEHLTSKKTENYDNFAKIITPYIHISIETSFWDLFNTRETGHLENFLFLHKKGDLLRDLYKDIKPFFLTPEVKVTIKDKDFLDVLISNNIVKRVDEKLEIKALLKSKTKDELKQICQENDIKFFAKSIKQTLIDNIIGSSKNIEIPTKSSLFIQTGNLKNLLKPLVSFYINEIETIAKNSHKSYQRYIWGSVYHNVDYAPVELIAKKRGVPNQNKHNEDSRQWIKDKINKVLKTKKIPFKLKLFYKDYEGKETERLVTVKRVYVKNNNKTLDIKHLYIGKQNYYIEGFCSLRNEDRTFKVHRITNVRVRNLN